MPRASGYITINKVVSEIVPMEIWCFHEAVHKKEFIILGRLIFKVIKLNIELQI